MKDKMSLKEELKELSPWLLSMKEKGEGFKVPIGYFEHLQDEVLQKVKQEKSIPEPATPGWWEKLLWQMEALFHPQYRLAYASAAVLLLAAIVWVLQSPATTDTQIQAIAIDQVPSEELIEYVDDNLEDFATDELLEISQFSNEELSLPDLVPSPEESEIEEYLDEIMYDINEEEIQSIL